MSILTVYLIALWAIIVIIRSSQKHGSKVRQAQTISNLPFGSIFFQEGLYFDCAICLNSFLSHEEVVGLTCNETHVYHPRCLIGYLEALERFECLLCDERIAIAKPDEEELIFSGNVLQDENYN